MLRKNAIAKKKSIVFYVVTILKNNLLSNRFTQAASEVRSSLRLNKDSISEPHRRESTISAGGDGGGVGDERMDVHGVVSKVPSKYLIQIFTEADGYNSGRVYRLAAGYVCMCVYI